MAELKTISCDPACGFMIRSEDEQEVLDTARKHVKNKHNMEVSDEDLRKRMTMETK